MECALPEPDPVADRLMTMGEQSNVAGAWQVDGEIDLERLRRAAVRTAAGNPALRLRAVGMDLHVDHEPHVRFDVFDVTAAVCSELRARELVAEHAAVRFELGAGPLWSLQACQTAPRSALLSVVLDALVADEASVDIFINQVSRHYSGGAESGRNEPPAGHQAFWEWVSMAGRELPAGHSAPPGEFRLSVADVPVAAGSGWPGLVRRCVADVTMARIEAICDAARCGVGSAVLLGLAVAVAGISEPGPLAVAMSHPGSEGSDRADLIGPITREITMPVSVDLADSFLGNLHRVQEEILVAARSRTSPPVTSTQSGLDPPGRLSLAYREEAEPPMLGAACLRSIAIDAEPAHTSGLDLRATRRLDGSLDCALTHELPRVLTARAAGVLELLAITLEAAAARPRLPLKEGVTVLDHPRHHV